MKPYQVEVQVFVMADSPDDAVKRTRVLLDNRVIIYDYEILDEAATEMPEEFVVDE